MIRAATLIVLIATSVAGADPWVAGTTIRPFALEDQHGVRATVDERVGLLLLTRDMAGGGVLKEALSGSGSRPLDARSAVYVADVSRMPRLVLRMFALPSLRKRPYRILLDRDGAATRDVPAVAGAVTAVTLDRLRVTGVSHLTTAGEVRAALEPVSPER